MARHLQKEDKIDYLRILFGTGLMAFSVNFFFNPASMVPGGFTGMAIIIQRLTSRVFAGGIPVWAANLLLNIPLILAAVKIRGWAFIRRTFAAAVLYSVWMFVLPDFSFVGDDLLITALCGGAIMGFGLGFVFLGKATTGGTDTVAALVQKWKPHLSTAAIYPVLDATIILLAAWILGLRISLYAAFSVFLSGRVNAWVVSGVRGATNQVFIISDRHEEISHAIMEELSRGCTVLYGRGQYSRKDRPVLLCAVSKRQTVDLRDIVFSIDERAFVIVSDAKEIRGEGFLAYDRDEL